MADAVLFTETHGDYGERNICTRRNGRYLLRSSISNRSKIEPFYTAIITFIKDAILPQGFPNSVHPDYVSYQIWDTIQAFSSTIMGTLTTHSIMQGVGVGDSNATALAATVTWILKDGTGMIGRILFTWWNGSDLDRQCKKWRLVADVLNDLAMGIELAVPYISLNPTMVLCASTAMKSVVGVAGGATRAALTYHQALRNNFADVAAKDNSQETCVNLIASFVGIFILSIFSNGQYLIPMYIFLVFIHIYANYLAVKSLQLNSLNEDRLAIIMEDYFTTEILPNPKDVNMRESLILFNKPFSDVCGYKIKAGVSLKKIIDRKILSFTQLEQILNRLEERNYLIIIDHKRKTISIPLKRYAEPPHILQAYFHACLSGLVMRIATKNPTNLLRTADKNDTTNILAKINILCKNYLKNNREIFPNITVDTVCITDPLVDLYYETFKENFDISAWNPSTHLIPISEWRFIGIIKNEH